uniref:Uncharacterized protein n=1 Tax=Lepeophtheirus salmonis TaxID=72036 RepID=A0A0K2TCQ3_LEPSM
MERRILTLYPCKMIPQQSAVSVSFSVTISSTVGFFKSMPKTTIPFSLVCQIYIL